MAPDYPPAAEATKTTGYVDVELLITEYGHVGEVRSLKSTPKNVDFEKAIRDVIDRWFFYAARSKCRPAESVGNVRVWFDIKDGKGMVSVSKPKPQSVPDTSKLKFTSTNIAAILAATMYPERARRANAQGDVHMTITVDPKTGSVASIDDVYARSIPEGSERHFAAASRVAIAEFKAVAISDSTGPIVVCVPFQFRLTP